MVVVAVGGFLFLTRDTSDPELTLTDDTAAFPEATFTLTGPIELPTTLTDGGTLDVTATGELTLHGVTNAVTIDLTVRASGAPFTVQGNAPIQMADYDIEAPSVGGFVTVEDNGSFEFLVNFEKG